MKEPKPRGWCGDEGGGGGEGVPPAASALSCWDVSASPTPGTDALVAARAAAAAAVDTAAAAAAAAAATAAAVAGPRHPPGTYPSSVPLFRKRTPHALHRWGEDGGPRRQAGEWRLCMGREGVRGEGVRGVMEVLREP